jgi:hypothetical protein
MKHLAELFSRYSESAVFLALRVGSWIDSFKLPGVGRDWISCVRAMGRSAVLALALVTAACGPSPQPPKSGTAAADEWREFAGSWNAAGSRRSISLGTDRRGSIIDLRGSMLLAGPGRPGIGFRSDVIALVDSQTGLVGRGVWTDENGDQVFSELKGQKVVSGDRITGTITAGTGRFDGADGLAKRISQFVDMGDATIEAQLVDIVGYVCERAVTTMIRDVEMNGYHSSWLAPDSEAARGEIEADRLTWEAGLGATVEELEKPVFVASVRNIRERPLKDVPCHGIRKREPGISPDAGCLRQFADEIEALPSVPHPGRDSSE